MIRNITIVGRGLVGLLIAKLLADTTMFQKIYFIDQKSLYSYRQSNDYDIRTVAVNKKSMEILAHAGLQKKLEKARHGLFKEAYVYDANGDLLTFKAVDIHRYELAYIYENKILIDILAEALRDNYNCIEYIDAKILSIQQKPDSILCNLDIGQQIESNYLIGADGRNSRVRQALGISVQEKPYYQDAVVTMIETKQPHQNIARQCFHIDSIIGMLPLEDPYHYNLIWSMPCDIAAKTLLWSEQTFIRILKSQLHFDIGTIRLLSPRAKFVLKQQQSHVYAKQNWALIGDAAHVLHPLAGQGVNLGFADAYCLYLCLKKECNYHVYLKRYAIERRMKAQEMMRVINLIKSGFQMAKGPFNSLFAFGFRQANWIFFKKNCMKFALGQDILV